MQNPLALQWDTTVSMIQNPFGNIKNTLELSSILYERVRKQMSTLFKVLSKAKKIINLKSFNKSLLFF